MFVVVDDDDGKWAIFNFGCRYYRSVAVLVAGLLQNNYIETPSMRRLQCTSIVLSARCLVARVVVCV